MAFNPKSNILRLTWSDTLAAFKVFVLSYHDIFLHILSLMTLGDIVKWASVNKYFRSLCQIEFRIRYDYLVKHYVDNVLAFSRVLLGTRTVISGSGALLAMDHSDSSWIRHVKDLDLYTCFAFAPQVLAFLQVKEHYVQTSMNLKKEMRVGGVFQSFYYTAAIRQVVSLVRPSDGRRIDVIISSSMYGSTLPIFQFHSTIVMNYITPHLAFCAYPLYTFNRKGLINWTVIENVPLDGYLGPVNLVDRARGPLEKYSFRGYTLALTPYLWDHRHQINCRFGGDCRGIRNTNDGDSIIFPFGQSMSSDDSIAYNWEGTLPGGHVQWSVGGSDCIVLRNEINYPAIADVVAG